MTRLTATFGGRKGTMAVIKEGDWLYADDLEQLPEIAELTARVLTDPTMASKCAICGSEQPDDIKWPSYAMEVGDPRTGRSVDIEYRACPKHEAALDAMLADAGVR